MWEILGQIPGNSGGQYWNDAVAFKAVLQFLESNALPEDTYSGALSGSYSDSFVTPLDLYYGALAGVYAETSAGQLDNYSASISANYPESNASPSDAYSGALMGTYADSNATPSEALKASFAGLADTNATPTDSRSTTTRTWCTSHTTSGRAPTSPANGYGATDGVLATIAGANGLSTSTCTVVYSIPVGSIPAGGTKTLKVYFQIALGALDTASVAYSNPGGSPASGTLASGNTNNLTNPATATITTIGSSFTITAQHTGSLLGGAGVTYDSGGIETVGL